MNESFILLDVDGFDARRGYTRWVSPGVGANFSSHPQAVADLWTDRDGRLFTRFSCSGYVYHYEIVSASRTSIAEAQMAEIEKFLDDKLLLWVTEGIDDSVLNM